LVRTGAQQDDRSQDQQGRSKILPARDKLLLAGNNQCNFKFLFYSINLKTLGPQIFIPRQQKL
jgi:hypothetical protein